MTASASSMTSLGVLGTPSATSSLRSPATSISGQRRPTSTPLSAARQTASPRSSGRRRTPSSPSGCSERTHGARLNRPLARQGAAIPAEPQTVSAIAVVVRENRNLTRVSDDGDEPDKGDEQLDFDELVFLLGTCCGGYVEVSVEASPAVEDGSAVIARFAGVLGHLRDRQTGRAWSAAAGPRLGLDLYGPPGDDRAGRRHAASVILNRNTFQRCDETVDDPVRLRIWQRGIKLTLDVHPPVAEAQDVRIAARTDDDIPF